MILKDIIQSLVYISTVFKKQIFLYSHSQRTLRTERVAVMKRDLILY